MTRKRRAFSLRTLLGLTLLSCLILALFLTAGRMRVAEREVKVLRDELGYLSVDDRTKIYVISVDAGEEGTWRWRCFLPGGRRYSIHAASTQIPVEGAPLGPAYSGFSNHTVDDGGVEVLVTARLRKTDDGNWRLAVASRTGGASSQYVPDIALDIPAKHLAWQENHHQVLSGTMGLSQTAVADPDEPIVLRSFRPYYKDTTKSGTGYAIWLRAQ